MSPSHLPTRRRRAGLPAYALVAALAAGVTLSVLPAVSGSAAAPPSTRSLSGVVVDAAAVSSAVGTTDARTERRGKKKFWKFVAAEQFNRFDENRWGKFSGRPGCCPDAMWDPSMVKVRNGKLELHTGPRDGRYLSGGVGGWDWQQGARKYGRWDARIRFDRGAGVSAAALLWPSDNGWPPELDFYEIFETWGDRSKMSVTTHWKAGGEHRASRRVMERNFTRWHVASVRWMPGRVAYYLNDRLVKVDRSSARIPKSKMWVGFQTHAHRMNGRYVRMPEGKRSVALRVDWVKVYKRNR